jgi:hypothetical protein
VTLVEKPSVLTVRAEPAGARVSVDGAPFEGAAAGAEIAPGKHRVAIALEGHAEERREIEAREGRPIEIVAALSPLVPVRVVPAGAELLLDGKPLVLEGGRAALSAGAHALVARAAGYRERRIEVPEERGAGFELAVELESDRAPVAESESAPGRRSRWTLRRKLSLVAGGVALGAGGAGVALGLKASSLDDEGRTRDAGERRLQSQLAYAGAGVSVLIAIGLWIDGEPDRPHVALTPLRGGASIGYAARF